MRFDAPARGPSSECTDGTPTAAAGHGSHRAMPRQRTVSLFVDARFALYDGDQWGALDPGNGAARWSRYVRPGVRLRLVARARGCAEGGVSALDPATVVGRLPYYVGVRRLVLVLPRLLVAIARESARAEVVVLRLPGAIGTLAAPVCRLLRRRYAVEVVGDPVAVLSTGSVGRLGPLLAPTAGWLTRWVVRHASAALYVTETTLQRSYPPRRDVPVACVSGVRLEDSSFLHQSRTWRPGPIRVVTVGSQEVPYKGHDVLLRAVRRLRSDGIDVSAVIVGDGRLHHDLVDLAARLGIADSVVFTGAVRERAELMALLDQASVFVLPSRTEGLPRALLEAMARGLPAVGSDVGGIPELLAPGFLVPADDPGALADKIAGLATDPPTWEAQSHRNLEVAGKYHTAALDARFSQWLRAAPDARERTPR